ncbi:phosphatase PAP2 family protein ['Fragaria x ananassa' phyllody phytoplasma]|uniref:Phosphatase PAP2 family protein n=1 Tax='Fragaria x ananassa' phyllody phytoplasma TaxID=2358428 RepID=A0ABS5K2Q9_9MOLU|nr:phosphatase PAP2 family protein ['Fragaria x ananassa' phyllody phytoplasma]MBS2126117.1 phosphatase PAP2 family protein ['Fragaria x ananassa' phyllody phytoplasma]
MKKKSSRIILTKTNTKKIKILLYLILCASFVIIHILSYYLITETTIKILHNNPQKVAIYNNKTNEKILNLGINILNNPDIKHSFLVIILIIMSLIYLGAGFWWIIFTPYLVYKHLNKDRIYQIFISLFVVLLITLIIFFIFPVQITDNYQWNYQQLKDTNSNLKQLLYHLLKLIYEHDSNRNNLLPSLHVSNSWFCYIVFRNNKHISKKIIYSQLIIALLVFVSTFVIKQHYIMDGIFAIILVEIVVLCVSKQIKSQQIKSQQIKNKLKKR